MRLRLPAGIAIALLAIAANAVAATAATPASGSLTWSHTSQDWSGTGMQGSAPAFTRITCNVPTVCDDFSLTVNTQKAGSIDHSSLADVKITPSAGAAMYLIVYPPSCTDTGPTSTCYSKFGLEWRALDPPNGNWVIRTVCDSCPPGSSYTAHGTLRDQFGAAIPSPGDQTFKWSATQLPPKDSTGTAVPFGEPGIWFNGKGFGIANTFGPTAWVTRDNGKTWSLPDNLGPQDTLCLAGNGSSGDADAVVANDGAFYLDNLCLPGVGGTSNDVFVNQAGGDPSKWTGPTLAGGDVDRQWLVPDPQHAGTVYMEFHDLEGPDINVLKSTDFGQTWICPITGLPEHQCPVTLTSNSNTGFVDTGEGNTTARMLVDPTNPNRLYVAYADNCALQSATTPPTDTDFDLSRIHMAASTDGGATWVANTTPNNTPVLDANAAFGQQSCSTLPPQSSPCDNTISHTFPTDTIDSKGNLYLVFSMRLCNQTQTHLFLMASSDHGATWTRPRQVDQGGVNSNIFEWVAAGDPGRLAVTWYGSPAGDFNDINAQWSEMYAVSTNALSASAAFTQSRVSGARSIHNADICEAGTLCLATGGNRDLADFQGVAVDSCGFAHAIWTDDSTGTGVTMTARQTAGTNLFAKNPCAATTPFTAGAGYLPAGAALGAGLATAGLAVLVFAGLAWRRREA